MDHHPLEFQHGMPAVDNLQVPAFIDGRPAIVVVSGNHTERVQYIEERDNPGCILDPQSLSINSFPDIYEQVFFYFDDLFFGAEHFIFVFFQFRSDKAFRVNKCLFSYVILRYGIQVGFGDLYKISKYTVEILSSGRISRWPFFPWLPVRR